MNIVDIISATQIFEGQYKDAVGDIKKTTEFWNIYNPNSRELLLNAQYQTLRDWMFKLLQVCKKIDPEVYKNIHKGHPYFYIGIASYRLGDFETAISFFDAALSHDLALNDETETPVIKFFLLKGDDPRNAAQFETRYIETKVMRSINYYNNVIIKTQEISKFDIQDLRTVFIKYILSKKDDIGLRTLLTAFITFVVEWDFRNEHFDLGVENGTVEPLLMHLFRGCVLFESLLKRKPVPKSEHNNQDGELGKLLQYYKSDMKVNLPEDFANKKTGKRTLNQVLEELRSYKNLEIDNSILLTYRLRNVLGHSIAWNVPVDKKSYQELYEYVSASCLHVINCLWKNPS